MCIFVSKRLMCSHRTVLFWWNLRTLQGAPLTWIDGECLCRSTIRCLLSHNCWALCLNKHVCVFGTACTVQAGLKAGLPLVRHQQEGNLSWGATDGINAIENSSLYKISHTILCTPDLYPYSFITVTGYAFSDLNMWMLICQNVYCYVIHRYY